MKIVIVSNSPWRSDNSFGNSFSNLFDGMDQLEIGNIYCKFGQPDCNIAKRFFQITEIDLLRNRMNRHLPAGREISGAETGRVADGQVAATVHYLRKHKNQVVIWGRELLWKLGRWKSPELIQFLDCFQPELLFLPIYFSRHLHDINFFIQKRYQIPGVGYVSDDVYTLKQFSLSPLYWMDRFTMRRKLRKVFALCQKVYAISELQKEEYANIFGDKFSVLTKSADFSGPCPRWPLPSGTVRMVYAGNLSTGRWKALALIAEAAERLRQEGYEVELDIYSSSPQRRKMLQSLNRGEISRFHGAIGYEALQKVQREADILIHVEGLTLKSRLEVRHSFSTKLVDYFTLGKCIFAVGTADVASIQHLTDNDAAVVANTKGAVYEKLKQILLYPQMICEYGEKAYACGARHHDRERMQTMLWNDLKSVVESYENSAN